MSLVWLRHPETGGTIQAPESALPIYRQSNWELMPAADVAAMEKRLAQAAADDEQAMTGAPAPTPAPAPEPVLDPSPAPRKSGKENL